MAVHTAFQGSSAVLWQLLLLAGAVYAQNTATLTSDPAKFTKATSPSASLLPPFSSSSSRPGGATPTAHDDAPGGNGNGNGNNSGISSSGLVNYYFVFLALLLCCIGLAIFFMFRRRAKRMARRRMGSDRESALQRDLSESGGQHATSRWDATRGQRRYWQGRWRSADVSQEEGLNEHGEAPPPYVPKRDSEERRNNGEGDIQGPAVPLQTLSRDDVGLKPPDYSETHTSEMEATARDSTASASSSRLAEHRTTS